MRLAEPLLQELLREGATTRRLLERVPSDKLGYQPHEKSMTLGALAQHIALVPGFFAGEITKPEGGPPAERPAPPTSTEDLLAAHDKSQAAAKAVLETMDDATLLSGWKFVMGGKPIMEMPRLAVMRVVGMNHVYHHRGQLSVYLRMLGVPVPSIYGPSADENPFG